MEPAPNVGRVFSPLDEELALLAGNLAPRQQDHLVHLAAWMPFARAAQMLARLLGVQVSEETVRRYTEEAGRHLQDAQTEQAQAPWQEENVGTLASVRLALSADGAQVPLVKGEWAEVRTLAIGTIKEASSDENSGEQKVEQLSYFSRLTTAETFTDLAEVEMRRRKVVQAQQVCAVSDGAEWLQSFFDVHRADAVRILDFPHAAEHLSDLLEAAERAGLPIAAGTFTRCLHVLKHRGPSALLRLARRLPPEIAQREGIREHLGYFNKREPMMQYPHFQQQGWPIGSGMVESANKLVVQTRLKGAGMRWQRCNVNPMLALRNAVCNERWSEMWHVAIQRSHQHQAERRFTRAEQRKEAALIVCNPLLLASPPLPPQPATPPPPSSVSSPSSPPAATVSGSCRPSKHHPWKRGPACVPKSFAKI
jgi:hypothetical protein